MSDEEFDEESFRAYENDLYCEKSSDSEGEIDSEIEEALYSQVHYSFSLPSQDELDENDVGSSSPNGNQTLPDTKQQLDDKENPDDQKSDKNSTEIIIISEDDDDEDTDGKRDNGSDNDKDNMNDDDKKSAESPQENWSLIKEDLVGNLLADGKKRPVSRYYKSEANFRCHNCNEKGHKAKDCPTPKKISCFLCGGDHIRRRCPNELCFNCHEPGHRVVKCKEPRSHPNDQCRRCFMLGHHYKNCPDLWRQYHRTTDASKKPLPDRSGESVGPVYCYNCSQKGHYGHTCTEERMEYHLSPTFPVVVKYDGAPEHHRDNHSYQKKEKNRKRTKTHDGTVSQYQDWVRERHEQQQRGKRQRKSWPNQSYEEEQSSRFKGMDEFSDGRVGQYREGKSERAKKRQSTKGKRNSWPDQSYEEEQSSRIKGTDEFSDGGFGQYREGKSWLDQDYDDEERSRMEGTDDYDTLNSPSQYNHQGSTYWNSETGAMKKGSKRKHCGTPHHGEMKKAKHEHKMNKRKNKKKDSYSASHNERIVELVYPDDELYGNNHLGHKEKRSNKKFNKQRDSPPDAFAKMVEDWEEMNVKQHQSSPGYSQRKTNFSPGYNHNTSLESSQHYYKRGNDKRSSREYHSKSYHTTERGFRSKRN